MDGESSRYNKLEDMLQGGSSDLNNVPLKYLRNITNNFSDERLLGEGGFGTVYKGVPQNGEMIAVKKFKLSIPGVQDRQFENEASHLMKLKHPNIVLLVGWCSETQYIPMEYNGTVVRAEKSERLLCLEYMPKGNLRGFLSDESSGLGWDTRYKIIQGICYGLRYLHEEWKLNAPIVHMDLKPANILLDNNMVPKIADFGLSRLFSEEKTWTCTISRDGTLGYMSPEYINKGLVSTMSDIFSLGVIIIEMVTGSRDYPDETGTSYNEFIETVRYNWTRRNWMESFIGNAQLEVDCQQIRRCSQITRCIQIGLDCVKSDRCKRPTISQIIRRLDGLGSDFIISNTKEAVTYKAGLSTPGGFFSDSQDKDHIAGDPMLRGHRFMGFFYFNTTSFVASLVGSSRSVKTSVYVVVALAVAALSYIGLKVLALFCMPVKNWVHNIQDTLQDQIEPQDPRVRAAVHIPQETAEADQFLQKSRMYLLLLGIFATSVTYKAGLNPPGGFWQAKAADGVHHYLAGDPVLHNTYPQRYLVFFYCNATAFATSVVILILLLSNTFSTQGIKYRALQVSMMIDLLGVIGAYAAGSCRQVSKSLYISVLVIPVFLYVGIHGLVFMFPNIATWRKIVRNKLGESVPSRWLKRLLELPPEEDEDLKWKLEKRRKLLLLLAILAASLTYQAGLSPPGGFWQENKTGHVVGNPVLNDNYPRHYLAFFYCNATAFVSSLAIIMLLVNRKLSSRGIQSHALSVCVVLDLVGLMGAFAAGSSRKVSTSIYVLVLVFAALVCIILQVVLVVSESVQDLLQRLLSFFDITEGEVGFILPHIVANNGGRREKLPKYLLLLAALAAAVTHEVAIKPPGGLWDDGQTDHVASDPVLRSSHPNRYKAFFYCNATSFMASLVIMVLLLIKRVCREKQVTLPLHTLMILNLFGLMGAYASGSCRTLRTSAYILALVIGVSVYIVVLVIVSTTNCRRRGHLHRPELGSG